MTVLCDETHAPDLQSWVESAAAADTDFPIQNLPFARYREAPGAPWRIGVAIGDQVLDVQGAGLLDHADMNRLMAEPSGKRRALRQALSRGLREASPQRRHWSAHLRPQRELEFGLPCAIGDYTDFYAGIHHARSVGALFRPDQPLLPNYKWIPIGYHGRASSIVVSGTPLKRPRGQVKLPGSEAPAVVPTGRLDYELELAAWVGTGNALGEPIDVASAESHVFGLGLLNDWSARDLQAWEYQPLGPFLSKNFGTTVSPWIVTLEALAPFRSPFERSAEDPAPLEYLDAPSVRAQGMFDITLEVWLQSRGMAEAGLGPVRLSTSNARDAYWAVAQLLAHHTLGGCNLAPGDLLGSGTLSGPAPEQGGSLLELTRGGQEPLLLPTGEQRRFLHDGDTIALKAYCDRSGARRIGFGPCEGTVAPCA